MQKIILKIDGMSCEHCAKRIENVLKTLPGIYEVKVNLESKLAMIKVDGVSDDVIKSKIEDIGFTVTNIEEG